MSQDSEKYYLIFEAWSMDPNQWSILIDSIAVLLAIFGVLIGVFFYRKQRRDNSKDAFDFFQSSMPELIQSIEEAIVDLKEFHHSLDLDNFVNPILSASLNDKFLRKISLVHLNRYYANRRTDKLSNFKQLLIDSNFFGGYHSYITKEIHYFRTSYQEKKSTYSKWRLLRSNKFFSTNTEENEPTDYKEFYTTWVTNLNQHLSGYEPNIQEMPLQIKRREALVEHQIKNLSHDILPFVEDSESANEVSLLAHKVVSAYNEMTEMEAKIRNVLEKDIARFEEVLSNMKHLLE